MSESLNGLKRNMMCGEPRKEHVGSRVILNGWVHKRRDHGGLIFLDLRDKTGIVQVVFSPDIEREAYDKADKVRGEYVLALSGDVRERPEGTVNEELDTGEIEVVGTEIRILNEAKTPPFSLSEAEEVEESIKLKYRYIDLRRYELQDILKLRHKVSKNIRDFLDAEGFWEIETPMLTRSTPEGARDYLVPSRLHWGEFYALPQSPQIFKQILMVSGVEKYFQIVRCFRDEDLRADRQPEFTQLDMEMSFVDDEDVMNIVEGLISFIFEENLDVNFHRPFARMTYDEAVNSYGTDRPDTRFDLHLVDISDIGEEASFKVFSDAVVKGGSVKGINARGCGSWSRKEIDDLTGFVGQFGAKGLAWIIVTEDGVKSPIAKFFTDEQMSLILERLNGRAGDLLLFVADTFEVVTEALGNLRIELAKRLNLIDQRRFEPVWVTDFPLVEFNEDEKRWDSNHHPFTAPREQDIKFIDSDPERIKAKAYDLVINGVEVGGGSIRIHERALQEKIFNLLGLNRNEIESKFGFMLEAFEYGAPPHGGIAFGLDRIVAVMAGKESIRDCIVFPKTQSATCLMTAAPSPVAEDQLKELGIRFISKEGKRETL